MELFPNEEKISFEKFKQIKFDRQLPSQLRYQYGIDSMFSLNESEHPLLAQLISGFKGWNKRGDADNRGAAIFLLTYLHLSRSLQGQGPRQITKAEAIETYISVQEYMNKYFGRTDISLGDLQKLVRGEKDWPLGGLPDLLSPQWTGNYKDGRLRATGGDGLVMFVRFPKEGLPVIETMNMYGASSVAGNNHFDDQVEMYLQQKTKKMTLDKKSIYKNAERIEHPL